MRLRYGMVGGDLQAFIGEVHRKALNYDNRVELVSGSFSKDYNKNLITGKTYNLSEERIYKTYQEMALKEKTRKDKIDFVAIVTPNNTHFDIAKTFLEADINVVCEKPLSFTVEEAEELSKIAKEKNLVFAVMYSYTGYPMVKYAKEMIEKNLLGNIISINAEYAQDWLLEELQNKALKQTIWRMDPKYSGISNCVGDIGTHIENMVSYLTGFKIKRLLAVTKNFDKPLDLDAKIIVEYENGIMGQYWSSQIASGNINGLLIRIYGDKGSLEWEQHYPDYLKYSPLNEPTQILSKGRNYLTLDAKKHNRTPSGHPEGYYIAFANVYKNIITTLLKIKNKQPLTKEDLDFPTVEDGLSGVKFVRAVIESSKKDSKWINIK